MKIKNILYDSFPTILHNPLSDLKNDLWEHCVNFKHKDFQLPKNISLITWNNSREPGLLEINLRKTEVPYVCLGHGINNWGNRHKITLTYDFVKTCKDEFIIGLDCYDTLFIRNPINILNDFLETKTQILFNATSTSWPDCPTAEVIEKSLCKDEPFRYLNSGAFIGKTKFLKTFLENVMLNEDNCTRLHTYSDQIKYKKPYFDAYPDVKIDSRCKIFQVMFINHERKHKFEEVVQIVP